MIAAELDFDPDPTTAVRIGLPGSKGGAALDSVDPEFLVGGVVVLAPVVAICELELDPDDSKGPDGGVVLCNGAPLLPPLPPLGCEWWWKW